MSSGPDLPPRPARGNFTRPPPSPSAGGGSKPPPVPAPRSSHSSGGTVSALARSFQGSANGPPTSPHTPPPPLPAARQTTPVPAPSEPPPPTPPPSRPMRKSASASLSASTSSSAEGFGACLQNCYDSIGKRHEDELVALESLRSHIFSRSRLDKDYSDSLAKMNMKASRKMNIIGNKSSSILQVNYMFEV